MQNLEKISPGRRTVYCRFCDAARGNISTRVACARKLALNLKGFANIQTLHDHRHWRLYVQPDCVNLTDTD